MHSYWISVLYADIHAVFVDICVSEITAFVIFIFSANVCQVFPQIRFDKTKFAWKKKQQMPSSSVSVMSSLASDVATTPAAQAASPRCAKSSASRCTRTVSVFICWFRWSRVCGPKGIRLLLSRSWEQNDSSGQGAAIWIDRLQTAVVFLHCPQWILTFQKSLMKRCPTGNCSRSCQWCSFRGIW